jgi:hypothetical protein
VQRGMEGGNFKQTCDTYSCHRTALGWFLGRMVGIDCTAEADGQLAQAVVSVSSAPKSPTLLLRLSFAEFVPCHIGTR